MRALACLALVLFFTACSGASPKPSPTAWPAYEQGADAAQQKMCIEENVGLLRFSRSALEKYCPQLKTAAELTCFRFVHGSKDWYKACPGIDTPEKLECFATVANGTGYVSVEALEKCHGAANRRQIYCLSERVVKSAIPLLPEVVQECLDKNP